MRKLLALFALCVFSPITAQNNIILELKSSDTTHAFVGNKPVQLLATIKNLGLDTLKKVKLMYVIQSFDGKTVKDSSFQLDTILPKGVYTHTYVYAGVKKDFYNSTVTLTTPQTNMSQSYAFAIDPISTISPYPRPKDFKQFWVKTLAELRRIPPSYTLTKSTTLSNDTMDVFSVEMRSLDSVRIQGWYVVPKGKQNLPALIYFQGYTTNNYPAPPYFKFSKYAQFFLNIRGHGDSNKDVNPGFGAYLTQGLKSRSTYIFRGAYMDCIRSLDFVCNRPEVDSKRIGIWGGSMGGALALATAGLDRRVKMCVFDLPFMSDFRNYFNISNFLGGEVKQFSAQNGIPMTDIYNTLDYFDIKNFASWVQCPVMMGVGLLDKTCPPAINFAAFNNLRVRDRVFYLFPYTGHLIPIEHNIRLFDWFDKRL
jgi:cephalosporin-C deacetylase